MGDSCDDSRNFLSSSSLLNSTPPFLPIELEREIFETAAKVSPQCASNLVQVARRVQDWIEPIMYNVLVFSTEPHLFRWRYPPLYGGQPPLEYKLAHFEKATRHAQIALIAASNTAITVEVLKSCINVVDLDLWACNDFCTSNRIIPSVLASLPLVKLCTDVEYLLQSSKDASDHGSLLEFNYTICMNVTHLEVVGLDDHICQWEIWEGLSRMPMLTHLALEYSTAGFLGRVLEECQTLKLIALVFDEFCGGESPHPDVGVVPDKRVVRISDDHLHDWELAARGGGKNIWGRAEPALGLTEGRT